MRTILMFYSLKKLNNLKMVFDIKFFKKHKSEYLQWLYDQHLNNDNLNEPTFQVLKDDPMLKEIIKNFENIEIKEDKYNTEQTDYESEYYRIKNSLSYRLGKKITFMPRKIRDFIKLLKIKIVV